MEAHPYHSAFLDMADQQFDLLGQCARANYIKVLNQIFCDRQINWGRLVMVREYYYICLNLVFSISNSFTLV